MEASLALALSFGQGHEVPPEAEMQILSLASSDALRMQCRIRDGRIALSALAAWVEPVADGDTIRDNVDIIIIASMAKNARQHPCFFWLPGLPTLVPTYSWTGTNRIGLRTCMQ